MTNHTIPLINHCFFLAPTNRSERINAFAIFVLTLLLSMFTVIANAMVIYIFIVKLKRYTKVSDLLLISLAICDLFAGVIFHPVGSYVMFMLSTSTYTCGAEFFLHGGNRFYLNKHINNYNIVYNNWYVLEHMQIKGVSGLASLF